MSDPCFPNPCLNNGTCTTFCTNDIPRFECTCMSIYRGRICQYMHTAIILDAISPIPNPDPLLAYYDSLSTTPVSSVHTSMLLFGAVGDTNGTQSVQMKRMANTSHLQVDHAMSIKNNLTITGDLIILNSTVGTNLTLNAILNKLQERINNLQASGF